MTRAGDSPYEMSPTGLLDDATIDALAVGDPVDPRFDRLVPLADGLRALGDEPLPPVSAGLEAVLAGSSGGGRPLAVDGDDGDDGDEVAQRRRQPRRRRRGMIPARVAARGVVAKVALGAVVAFTGLAVAGASGALPDLVAAPARWVVESLTPFEPAGGGTGDAPDGGTGRSTGPAPTSEPDTSSEPRSDDGTYGDDVSDDATGDSDGQTGVDGDQVSDEAPGAENRPDQPDHPGQTGRDRASETPAGTVLPSTPAATAPGSTSPAATAPGNTAPGATAPRATTSTTAAAST